MAMLNDKNVNAGFPEGTSVDDLKKGVAVKLKFTDTDEVTSFIVIEVFDTGIFKRGLAKGKVGDCNFIAFEFGNDQRTIKATHDQIVAFGDVMLIFADDSL
jgi:hypothetical protein